MYTIVTHQNYSYVQIVTIPFDNIEKIDFALCNQPTETPDAFYKRQAVKPNIITNGGFFCMNSGATCFSFVDEGKTVADCGYYGVGIKGSKELRFNKATDENRDFMAAYPPLIVDGKPYTIDYAKELNYKARRTCIGWNKENYYVVTVDKPGLAYKALQQIFTELGADYAINLDGGGSTRMLIDGKRKTSESYARPVDNVMCVYLRKEQPKTIYRVQVGAFSIKTNAEKLLTELQRLGFSDAYVKKVGVYYKVQVGAFSVKLNAERLKDRLVAMGYKPFITTN